MVPPLYAPSVGEMPSWRWNGIIADHNGAGQRSSLTCTCHRLMFLPICRAYSNSSTPLDLFTFLEDMRASGVSPDRVTFNQLLVGAARAGGREGAAAAAQIMARMKGLAAACEDVSLLPDSISYSCALRAALGSATPVMDTQQLLSEIEDG